VERASSQRYDFILMDMMMPELDGLSATRAIRALPEPFASVPIVALTANAFVEDREAAFAAGMNAFATKPITGKRLLEAIRACVKERGAPVAAAELAPRASEAKGPEDFDVSVLESLREELGADYVEAAIDMFLADLRTRLDEMKRPELPQQALGAHGHALKSAAGILGLTKLAHAAEQIERSVRRGESAKLDAQVRTFFEEASCAPTLLRKSA
jgi:CheY-like chemotaxis protein